MKYLLQYKLLVPADILQVPFFIISVLFSGVFDLFQIIDLSLDNWMKLSKTQLFYNNPIATP